MVVINSGIARLRLSLFYQENKRGSEADDDADADVNVGVGVGVVVPGTLDMLHFL